MLRIFKEASEAIFRKRSLEKSSSLETKLCRCISSFQLFFYSISMMAGAGIYILAGHVIKNRAGPSTNLSFFIGGISSIFTGLCYCELATLMPQAGSCYTYTYVMIGELPAFIIAWTVIMDCVISLASVAKGFSGVVNIVCNDAIANFTRQYLPLASNSTVWDSSADIVAASLILLLFFITITGANLSFQVNTGLQTIQIVCLSIVTIAFYIYGSPKNYVADGGYMPFGVSGIIQGAGIAIFAFSGFEGIANCAEEMKNPKKSIPIAMFSSLGVVLFLYVFVTSGLSYMVPRLEINEKSPFVAAFENKHLPAFKWIAVVGTLIATGATKLTVTYLIGRVIYAVAKDGLIFKCLGNVNQTSHVPIIALFVGCFFAIVLALFIKIESLADVTSMGILLSFVVVGIDLIYLRYIYYKENRKTEDSNEVMVMSTRVDVHTSMTSRRFFLIVFGVMLFSILCLEVSLILIIPLNFAVGVTLSVIIFCFVLVSVTILFLYKPDYDEDAFQSPLMPLAPLITISVNTGLLLYLPPDTWIRFIVWLIVGLIIYFVYGMRNSMEGNNYMTLSDDNMNSTSTDQDKKSVQDSVM